MKKVSYMILFLFLIQNAKSQQLLMKSIGTSAINQGVKTIRTSDNGFAILSNSTEIISGSSKNFDITKFNEQGNIEWSKTYGSSQEEYGNDLIQTRDGGYVVVGYFFSTVNDFNGFILKIDSSGDIKWSKYKTSKTMFYSVRQSTDGSLIIVGSKSNSSAPIASGLALRIDESGNTLWSKNYNLSISNKFTTFTEIAIASNNSFYVTGIYGSGPNDYNQFITNLNSSGDTNFVVSLNTGYAFAETIKLSSNSIFVGGQIIDGSNNSFGLITKLDLNGNLQWNKQLGNIGENYKVSSLSLLENNPIVTFQSQFGNLPNGVVLKIDNFGNNIWSKKYTPTNGTAYFNSSYTSNNNEILLLGNSSLSNTDLFIVRTDTNGILKCNESQNIVNSQALGMSTNRLPMSYLSDNSISDYLIVANTITNSVLNQLPTVIVNSPSICSGSEAILTANGANSYSWSSGANSTSINTASAYPISSTIYSVTGEINGCSATAESKVTVKPMPNLLTTLSGLIISSNQSSSVYQWIDCKTSLPVLGETSQSFTPSISGNYAVIVYEGSCFDTSICINVSIPNSIFEDNQNELKIYPNPTNGVLSIEFNSSVNYGKIEIRDIIGKLVKEEILKSKINKVDIFDLKPGQYFLQIDVEDNRIYKLIIKE